MTNISKPLEIKELLHQALSNMGTFEECALLDYPDYSNIGDHLIWLGTVFYLIDVLKVKIKYAASIKNFSDREMEKQINNAPIILQGGGNLGDTWSVYQNFRENIIAKYKERPIIIMPQSIYFTQLSALEKAIDIFNSHPDLTLFVRENYSYNFAIKHFSRCRVIKAPDMAFQMVEMPGLLFNHHPKSSVLYHNRDDCELNQSCSPKTLDIPNTVVEDWVSYKWIYRETMKNTQAWYWQIPGSVKLFREGWQRGLANPPEWISRNRWEYLHSYTAKLKTIYHPELHLKSWSLMHSGVYQLKQYPLVITNRLHGHILCVILEIPHVFLPNNYYKNQSFYETWTYKVPFCRFIQDASQIKVAAQELLELFHNAA